jgi:YD repeat-containing protein
MATFETTRPAPFGAETLYRIVSVIDAGIATLVQWNNKRVTRNALGKLSARELADIGLTRSDVDAMSGPSYRNF